jgi:protein TonB
MDYLARYGPEGAFAEVAELRLKQLTSSSTAAPEVRAPAPSSRPMTPAPASRPTLPPRAEAPRRLDPPPPRREAPVRRPPPERGYDRSDLREPPRAEAGPMRAFILIALLGGAALAGGLYFGGGMPDFGGGNAAIEEQQSADAAAPPSVNYDEPSSVLDEPVGVPLEDAATPAPSARERERERTVETAARREPAAPTPRRTEPEDGPPPSPVTSWNSDPTNSGGPVSLASPNSAANTGAPVTAPAPANIPAASTATRAPATTRAGSVVWAQRPSARRVGELYPERASREGVGGRVELDCSVRSNQSLACSVANETPAGLGFGRAALNASNSYRAQPYLSDGTDATGARTRIVVQFQAPEE